MGTSLSKGLRLEPRQYSDFSVQTDQVTLRRPEMGKNMRLTVNGKEHEIGRIASVFPISSAMAAVAFFDTEGEEIGVMKQADSLDKESRRVLREELDKAYFMPSIEAIISTEENLAVKTWTVKTDKGARVFEVRDPRRNVRKIGGSRMLVKDVDGNRYEIRNWRALDRGSIAHLMPDM